MDVTADFLGQLDSIPAATEVPSGGSFKVAAGDPSGQKTAGYAAAKFGTKQEDVKRGSLYVTTSGWPLLSFFSNLTAGRMLVGLDTVETETY
ncbi:putative SMP-30/Gluconolactonase/LRE-like region domain-containing protein [Seiridium cardinale]